MLTGTVSDDLQAWVPVEVLDHDGQPRPIEVVLDTGFNGQLSLPAATIRRLELLEESSRFAVTATGDRVSLPTYTATVLWDGQTRIVEVVEADSEPLLGMELLLESLVTLEVRYGGPVTIDALP